MIYLEKSLKHKHNVLLIEYSKYREYTNLIGIDYESFFQKPELEVFKMYFNKVLVKL